MLRPIESDQESAGGNPAQETTPSTQKEDTLTASIPPSVEGATAVGLRKKKGDDGALVVKTPLNEPKWKTILRDIFNGIVIALSAFLCAGLLVESYIKDSYPFAAWVAFIPFCIALLHIRSGFLSFVYSFVVGLITYMGILYWIMPTVLAGTGNLNLSSLAVLALSCVLSIQFGFFGMVCHYLKRVGWAFPLTAACAWVAFEFLHQLIAYYAMAFPWFVLGYTQFSNISVIQISAFTGAYGVSFLIVFFGASIALSLTKRFNNILRISYFVLPVLLLVVNFIFGKNLVKEQEKFLNSNTAKISTVVMQTNTHKLMVDGFYEDVFYTIAEQAETLGDKKFDFIVWPESSLPGSFQDEDYLMFLKGLSALHEATQVTGSASVEDGKEYVSAGVIDHEGIKGIYHKNKLVPFGEFLPFKFILGSLYENNGIASLTGDFVPAKNPGKVFELLAKDANGDFKKYIFGIEICFESLFPSIWRKQADSGAQFFVNISNDGWFLDTAAAYQHLRINIFRAVENRRPVIRATNTGVSAWIDPFGRTKFETQLDKQEKAIFTFSFQPRTNKTFYTEKGDIFALVCLVLSVTVFIVSVVFLNTGKYDRA